MIAFLAAILLAGEQAPAAESTVVVRAARMLDVRAGKLVAQPVVTVRERTIAAVQFGAVAPVPGAVEIDLGDLTLVPGLIDCHTHLSGTLEGDFVDRPVHEGPADDALRGAGHARRTLLAGFTTVRDTGSADFTDVALARAVERGDVEGPWIVPCGHAIGITGGHADYTGFRSGILVMDPLHGIADGPDECRKAVREQAKYGARAIKCMATAGVLSFEASVGTQQLTDAELAAIVDEASRHGLRVAAHAHGSAGILAAVLAGVASIEHGSQLSDECIAAMLERGTYLVPTAYLRRAVDLDHLPEPLRKKAEGLFPDAERSLRRAIERGVKIAYGTDASVYPHGDNARELAVLVEAGMSSADALRTATVNAADLLGLGDRGAIEKGKLADLIAVQGDPLADVRVLERVRWVMHGGRVARALER